MNPRKRRDIVVAAVSLTAGLLLALLWWSSHQTRLHERPLRNIPASAMAMAHFDVQSVRGSVLWQRLVVDRGGDRALRELEAECGFDWSENLQYLTVFADGTQDSHGAMHPERVGLILEGEFDLEAMAACVSAEGEMAQVEIEGVHAVHGQGPYHAALLADGAILIGHEEEVRRTLRTIHGDTPSLSEVPGARALYATLSPRRHVMALLRLDSRWQEFASEAAAAVVDHPVVAPGLVVAGARVERGLTLGTLARFESEEDAAAFEAALEEARAQGLGQLALAISAVGPALREIAFAHEGVQVTAAVDLSGRRVGRLLDLLQ